MAFIDTPDDGAAEDLYAADRTGKVMSRTTPACSPTARVSTPRGRS